MRRQTILAFLILPLCIAWGQESPKEPKQRTVAVHGIGTTTTIPDQARIAVQVHARAESATGAMSTASTRTRGILAILKKLGIADKDIQTSRVTVTPILDYEKRIQPPPIVGYTGTNDFSVVFRGALMEKVGEFLDQAVAAGASGFGSLQYEASNRRELEREALKKAAADARARAEVLARELGAAVGTVMTISESMVSPFVQRGALAMTDASGGAPVMTGELTITGQVDVVFELR